VKYLALYSQEKYCNFSFDAQLKTLAKLLKELETNIADRTARERIIGQITFLKPLTKQALPQRMEELIAELPRDPHRLMRKLALYHNQNPLKDSQIALRTGDGSVDADPVIKALAAEVCVVADNLRSVFNVGSLFRTCECLAIGELRLCGISPDPTHPNMEKTALGTCSRVNWRKQESTLDAIMELKANGRRIYALETAEPSQSAFKAAFSFPMALVVGNEALGIDPMILEHCDEIIHLPVLGWKNSLNVSIATTVALYQCLYGGKNGA